MTVSSCRRFVSPDRAGRVMNRACMNGIIYIIFVPCSFSSSDDDDDDDDDDGVRDRQRTL
jgi:hypothetical protein